MRPHFYMDQLTPGERQTIRRWYGYTAAFYCCAILIAVVTASLTAKEHQSNGLGPVANAAADDGGVVVAGPSIKATLPMAKR
jgi:hypothetical protein